MTGTYDPWLVSLSAAVSVMASYVALDLAVRLTVSAGVAARAWLGAGAASMGMGIWSMHFIAMLAYRLPMPMSHDLRGTALSLLIAMFASGFALYAVSRVHLGRARFLGGGVLMGLGIAAMHYTGMAAMQMTPPVRYRPALFALSIVVAVVVAMVALVLAFHLRGETPSSRVRRKIGSAILMGAAICGMHYTGMAAGILAPHSRALTTAPGLDSTWLALTIGVFTSMLLLATLVVSWFDSRRVHDLGRAAEQGAALHARIAEQEAARESPLAGEDDARAIFETAHDAYVAIDSASAILEWNRKSELVFGWRREEVIGRSIAEVIIPPRFREAHFRGVERFLATGEGPVLSRRIELSALHRDGHEFPVELTIWPTRRGEIVRFHAFLHDISGHQRVVRRLAAQAAAAAALVESDRPEGALPRFFEAICTALSWSVGVLWTPDPAGRELRCEELWRDAEAAHGAFEEAIRERVFEPGEGLPGRVWRERQPEWVPGFSRDGELPGAADAARAGLHGAFALPIFSRGEIVAVLEFFSTEIQEPDPELLGIMETLGSMLGQYLAGVEADRSLEKSRRLLSEAQELAQLGSWEWEVGADRVSWSDEMFRLYALEPQQFRPTYAGFVSRVHADDRAQVRAAVEAALASKRPFEFDHRVVCPDGSLNVVHARGEVITDAEGRAIRMVGTCQDVTHRKEVEERLQRLAHFDPLTGLPNRRLFQESLLGAMAQADAGGWLVFLLFLDLDDFKDINDSLGHVVGDEFLRQAGQRLLSCLRVRDTVGRLGGDEFGVIVLSAGDEQDAAVVAEKIRAALREPFELEGQTITVTVSIGISVYPTDSGDEHGLIRDVDLAMYEAKKAGGDGYRFYTEAMNRRAREKRETESALREALAEGQFALHYQPKISLATGRWMGVEALLRWHRPGRGMVTPAAFIEVLEDTALIVPVGVWVIVAACRQLSEWRRIGMAPLPIAVNVSARQMGRDNPSSPSGALRPSRGQADSAELWSVVAAALEEHGVPPGQLELELTESTLMSDAELSIEKLRRLKDLGLRISVDDFGTGYSSLAYLRRFPLDAIKIDEVFIRSATRTAQDASITLAIIDLAHRLELLVVAEGVETDEQLQFLKAHGCDQAQGYHLARPMPADDLASLWRKSGGVVSEVV